MKDNIKNEQRQENHFQIPKQQVLFQERNQGIFIDKYEKFS